MQKVSNKAESQILKPYLVEFKIVGTTPILFHAWNNEAVAEKAKAKKGSDTKKTDNLESFIKRNEANQICLPTEYLRGAIIKAGKYFSDPRSPRKTAHDLLKAAITVIDELAPINGGVTEWDYEDMRKVNIQRNSITRTRPAFRKGWSATVHLQVSLPEYISQEFLLEIITLAGKTEGVGDFRPTFGRFQVHQFSEITE